MRALSNRPVMFGVPLDALTRVETVKRCAALIEEHRFVQHVVLNAGKVTLMADDPALRDIVSECDLVNADGMSIVWAGRMLGVPIPERVTGIDLMEDLLGLCSKKGWPVYVLGARESVLSRFLGVLRDRYPELIIAGGQHGFFDDEDKVVTEIRESGARLLLVGMPSPRKERFLWTHRDDLGPVFAMGVGGSLDVWAGETQRAPRWMQRSGLEWFYRFLQEPQRMWRRYLVGNIRFCWLVLREGFRKRSRR